MGWCFVLLFGVYVCDIFCVVVFLFGLNCCVCDGGVV